MPHIWVYSTEDVDWEEVANLHRIAPLGEPNPASLQIVFSNSRHVCFVYDAEAGILIGTGRALADGADAAYIADVAVHPDYQGTGIGKAIVSHLVERCAGHRKIVLYTVPGKERFYEKLGFRRMKTAMALFADQKEAAARGMVEE